MQKTILALLTSIFVASLGVDFHFWHVLQQKARSSLEAPCCSCCVPLLASARVAQIWARPGRTVASRSSGVPDGSGSHVGAKLSCASNASMRCDVWIHWIHLICGVQHLISSYFFTLFLVLLLSGKWPYDAWATEAKDDGSRLQSVGSHGRPSKSRDSPKQLHSVSQISGSWSSKCLNTLAIRRKLSNQADLSELSIVITFSCWCHF